MVYIKVSNKLKKKIVIFPVLILTFLVVTGCSATAPEFSTFSSNDEGWVVIGDPALPYEGGGFSVPEYGGEYAGEYIWVEDSVLGGVMYWVAPSKYLGDKSHYHGKYLKYDLREFYRNGHAFPTADVMLISNDGTILVYFSRDNYDNYKVNFIYDPKQSEMLDFHLKKYKFESNKHKAVEKTLENTHLISFLRNIEFQPCDKKI